MTDLRFSLQRDDGELSDRPQWVTTREPSYPDATDDEPEFEPRDWWADAPLADAARVRLQLDGYDDGDEAVDVR